MLKTFLITLVTLPSHTNKCILSRHLYRKANLVLNQQSPKRGSRTARGSSYDEKGCGKAHYSPTVSYQSRFYFEHARTAGITLTASHFCTDVHRYFPNDGRIEYCLCFEQLGTGNGDDFGTTF
jgi:hypothetical protein